MANYGATLSPEQARALNARSKASRRKLLPEDVEVALPPLETLEDAKARLDQLGRWIASGLLAGSGGSAAVRSVEAWVDAYNASLDAKALKEAERRITELEAELRNARGLRAVR